MEIVYTEKAKSDIAFWKKSGNKQIQKRISELISSIALTPYQGIGKPELLKYELAGKWSRRITQEHRIVYEVEETRVIIISLLYHYSK
jgi:toxin YoeB